MNYFNVHSDKGLTLKMSAFKTLCSVQIYIINSADKTNKKLSYFKIVWVLRKFNVLSVSNSCQNKLQHPSLG